MVSHISRKTSEMWGTQPSSGMTTRRCSVQSWADGRNWVYFLGMIRFPFSSLLASAALLAVAAPLFAQSAAKPKPEDTEIWEPVPPVVTPGATCGAAPSDAIVLFDGKNVDEWVTNRDKSPAKWTVADGVMTVNKSGRKHRNQTKLQELPASPRMEGSQRHHRQRTGARQQRRVSRFHRTRRRRI